MKDVDVWERLLSDALRYLPRLITAAALLLAFCLLGIGLRRLTVRLARTSNLGPDLVHLLGRIAKITLILFGAVMALGTMGIDVTALVASLGLTGFALGFALKDIISNALSGMLILIYKPFVHGDRVALPPFEGQVREINLRYTVLETADKRIFVPNANLFTNILTVAIPSSEPPTDTT